MKQKTSKKEHSLYYCKICEYRCKNKYNLNRHFNTTKHKMKQNETQNEQKGAKCSTSHMLDHCCEYCNMRFNSRTTLWRHKKKVHYDGEDSNATVTKLLSALLKQQTDTNKLVDSMQKMVEHAKSVNTNCNNTNHISINMFLNTECKDAMTLTDFVDNVKLSLEDLEYTNEHGRLGTEARWVSAIQ